MLYAALLVLFVLATKETTAANAIFLQYTAPVYVLIFEPLFYKEKFRSLDAGIVGHIEPVLNPISVFLVLGERRCSVCWFPVFSA